MNTLKNNIHSAMTNLYLLAHKLSGDMKAKLLSNDGQFVVDHAVVFVIIIVLGALVLTVLKNFVETDMAPVLKEKIMAFFN